MARFNPKVLEPDSATVIANFFIKYGIDQKDLVTNKKLNKLIYIAYGWTLAKFDRKLFSEPIEAWRHGPVIPSIYHALKHLGAKPVKDLLPEDLYPFEDQGVKVLTFNEEEENTMIIFLKNVRNFYFQFSGNELEYLTHQTNTPWEKAYKEGENIEISPEEIAKHYQAKMNG